MKDWSLVFKLLAVVSGVCRRSFDWNFIHMVVRQKLTEYYFTAFSKKFNGLNCNEAGA
jgi:hypothetical protein